MDLYCTENLSTDQCTAGVDLTMYSDNRVLTNLINSEDRNGVPPMDYFLSFQKEIKPHMRKIVNSWMQEVCDERHCEYQVLPYAVSIMDRFLCFCAVEKSQLQLTASACLLLASKIRECHALSVEDLVYYSDSTFSPSTLKKMELLVVCKIRWNLSTITASDFLDHILERVTWGKEHPLIRQHALTLINLCYTEYEFMMIKPSLIASGCILSAYNGLSKHNISKQSSSNKLHDLQTLSKHCVNEITKIGTLVDKIVQREMSCNNQNSSSKSSHHPSSNSKTNLPTTPSHTKEKPNSPVDVQDVRF